MWKRILLSSATKSVKISGCYAGGPSLQKMLLILEKQLERHPNLKIQILTNTDMLTAENQQALAYMATKYPRFQYRLTKPPIFMTPRLHRRENHVKLVVVDRSSFVVGGTEDALIPDMNQPEEGESPSSWRAAMVSKNGLHDMDVVGFSHETATVLDMEFDKLWEKWDQYKVKPKYASVEEFVFASPHNFHEERSSHVVVESPQSHEAQVAVLAGSAEHGRHNSWVEHVLKHVKSSEDGDTIYAANMCAYEKRITNALAQAIARGVQVKVITNGCLTNSLLDAVKGARNRQRYPALRGAELYEFQKVGMMFHKKVWLFLPSGQEQKPLTIIGSANISKKSVNCNDEVALSIRSSEIAAEVKGILDQDIAHSMLVTQEKVVEFSSGRNKLYGRALEPILANILN